MDLSPPVLERALFHIENAYDIPNVRVVGRVCKTNTSSNTAFRGFGGPQGMMICEDMIGSRLSHTLTHLHLHFFHPFYHFSRVHLSMSQSRSLIVFWRGFPFDDFPSLFLWSFGLDRVSRYLQIDPSAVRGMNLYHDGSMTPFHQVISNCRLQDMWDQLYASSDYASRRAAIEECVYVFFVIKFFLCVLWCNYNFPHFILKAVSYRRYFMIGEKRCKFLCSNYFGDVRFNRSHVWQKRGISMIPTKFGISFTAKFMNQGGSLVNVYADGSVLISHGGIEMGQGLHTKVLSSSHCIPCPSKVEFCMVFFSFFFDSLAFARNQDRNTFIRFICMQ